MAAVPEMRPQAVVEKALAHLPPEMTPVLDLAADELRAPVAPAREGALACRAAAATEALRWAAVAGCTSLTLGPSCDRFKLHIPYAGETLKFGCDNLFALEGQAVNSNSLPPDLKQP
ncbi:UNVERIFIED_CONTAM: hypothetical protein K2H54_055496 [Gekko kuhli]